MSYPSAPIERDEFPAQLSLGCGGPSSDGGQFSSLGLSEVVGCGVEDGVDGVYEVNPESVEDMEVLDHARAGQRSWWKLARPKVPLPLGHQLSYNKLVHEYITRA